MCTFVTEAFDVVSDEQLVFGDGSRQFLADEIRQAVGRQAGAGLLDREIVSTEHGAAGERAAGDDALREQTPERIGLTCRGVLVERIGAHALDEADAVDQLPQFGGRDGRDDVRPEHLARQRDVELEDVHADRDAGETGIDRP